MSAIQLYKVNPDAIPVPPVGAVLLFINENGYLSHKTETGSVESAGAGGGGVAGPAGADGAQGPQGVPGPAGAGGAGAVSRLGVFSGECVSQVGAVRYYPEMAGYVYSLTAWAGGPVTGDATVTLKKNGLAVGSCVIASGAEMSVGVALNVAVSESDFLTLDLACVVASDVCVRLNFNFD